MPFTFLYKKETILLRQPLQGVIVKIKAKSFNDSIFRIITFVKLIHVINKCRLTLLFVVHLSILRHR